MFSFPLLLTIYAGFTHAFEADHLLAVSNIVSQRNNVWASLKDGTFWGLGHASTIVLTGILMILFKVGIPAVYFHYFEIIVGAMLIALAVHRLIILFRNKKNIIHSHAYHYPGSKHKHAHLHVNDKHSSHNSYSLA